MNINNIIISKLTNGEHFGIFDDGQKCYFQDGTKVNYSDLWNAAREIHQLPLPHHKSLGELFPEIFEGSHKYSYSRHKWKANNAPNSRSKTGILHLYRKILFSDIFSFGH